MMIARRIALFLGAIAATSTVAFSAASPPEPPRTEISWEPKSGAKPVTELVMGTFTSLFEETSLMSIVNAAGGGQIAHQGDASESIYWLCYVTSTEQIWIIAHGEMGGPDHQITEIAVQAKSGAVATSDCPTLPESLRPVSLDGGLWIGLKEDVLKKLGQPSHVEGQWRAYNFQGTEPGYCQPHGFDVLNWLWVRTDDGRITAIHAGQITSC